MLGSLTEIQIAEFLREHSFAHLGCYAHEKVYVVPITYVYDGKRILGQTKAGMKIEMMRANPNVCVQVEKIISIAEWTSVIAWGVFRELSGPEAAEAMRILIDKLGPQIEDLHSSRSPRDITPGRVDGKPQIDIVYELQIEEMSGRFETP